MKKSIVSFSLTFALLLGAVGALPIYAIESVPTMSAETESIEISPRAEELMYYYRTTPEGLKQYRIWSFTRGIWLNDWTNCR